MMSDSSSNMTAVEFKIEPHLILATDLEEVGIIHMPVAAGGFTDIFKCSMSTDVGTRFVAVKSFKFRVPDTDNGRSLQRIGTMIRREVYVWIQLKHDHILPLEGVTIGKFGPLPALVSPWMEEGSLDDYLKRKFSQLSDPRKRELIWQLASALNYLHDRSIVHGDLTSYNILVDGSGSIRLADFCLSIILTEAENTMFDRDASGTVHWMPPESLEDVDPEGMMRPAKSWGIYSFGCVMLQILSGKQPYESLNSPHRIIVAISRGRKPFVDIQSHGGYGELATRCLNVKSAERPTIDEIMDVLSNIGRDVRL